MNATSIALFRHQSDAAPLQARLAAAGVLAELHHCTGLDGTRIQVPADQFERAYQLLLDWDAAEGALSKAIRCPECKSLRVEYPQYSHKSALPNLLVSVLANIGAMEKEFYCHDCHFMWPKEGTKPSRARPNMAPYYFIEGAAQAQAPQFKIKN
jgi:hypothetical protein